MITVQVLNVSEIEPRLKHPTIFKHFDELVAGEGFVIDNDHDPKPLYYQLLGERGAIFSWEYLENGPIRWKVRIAKNRIAKDGTSIGEIAASDIRKAALLRELGVEFSCGGHQSMEDVSKKIGRSAGELEEALKEAEKVSLPVSLNFNNWNVGFLCDFIMETHHNYVSEQSDVLLGLSEKVEQRHGADNPVLIRLAQGIKHFLHSLKLHLQKEAEILFPLLKDHNKAAGNEENLGLIKETISLLQREHVIMVEDLRYFQKITNNYTLPPDACDSFAYLYQKMKEFSDDVTYIIHIENNILFFKAFNEEMEKKQLVS